MVSLESPAVVSLLSGECFYSFTSKQQDVLCIMEGILTTLHQAMWLKP